MNKAPLVLRNVTIDNELFALVVTTYHDGAEATTAIHRQDFERRIGGARFVDRTLSLSEVGHLARTMTQKCMAAMIPADGQKSVIAAGPIDLLTEERRAQILVEHVRTLKAFDPGVIVGPDMGNPEAVQDRASRAEGLLDHFTGLSKANRGLSIDANGYTAQGVAAAVRACIGDDSISKQRVSIQGFGAVGAHTARLLNTLGAKIVAISNKDVLLTSEMGLDVPALFARFAEAGDQALKCCNENRYGIQVSHDPNEIFKVPTDVFVPAARTDILATAAELQHVRETENSDVRDVADFYTSTGVRLVVEGANHPLSPEAERWLELNSVRILPDFIVNCGGLIGCWVEWEARHRNGLTTLAELEQVERNALERIRTTISKNLEFHSDDIPARGAAELIVRRNRQYLQATRIS